MSVELILKDLNIPKFEGKTGSDITTFKIGGALKNLIYVNNKQKLSKLLQKFYEEQISYTILGNGSNVLFPDEEINNVIIKLGEEFSNINKIDENKFQIGASTLMPYISNTFEKEALSGFEFACSLPAELGGTLYMNASFRGQNISDILESIEICMPNGDLQIINKDKLEIIPKQIKIPKNSVITSAAFCLISKNKAAISSKIRENKEFRQRTQPKGASCGCIFKNPSAEAPAGMLLDKVGLKGTREGGAMYSTVHANWIINDTLKATSSDVKKLIDIGKEKVLKEFNINLETEVVIF